MDFKVTFSTEAQRDLFAIVRFLTEKNPAAAQRLGDALIEASLTLARFPHRGAPVRKRIGIRKLAHQPHHLIFYRVHDSDRRVDILRFWDGRQNPVLLRF